MEDQRRSHRGLSELTLWVPAEKAEAVRRFARRIGRPHAPPDREAIIDALRRQAPLLARFGVESLALFGSAVRNEAQPHSDIDLLAGFAPGRPSGMFELVELKTALEAILGHPVDLITDDHIKPRIRDRIMAEAVPVPLPAVPEGWR